MSSAPILHQEVRLSPAPASSSQVLNINTTPAHHKAFFGAGRKRAHDEISGLDEESYKRRHLATEGSVFFRRKQKGPRSFSWRVLEDGTLVEVQCVDLLQEKSVNTDSWLTFLIKLPDKIIQNGVAFGDPVDNDALDIFILTTKSELFTFTLKRDLLTRGTVPSGFDSTTSFKKFTSSSLPFNLPYRMVAVSSLELLISLHNGGFMRLERQPNETGAQWRETFFSKGHWGDTIKGLISLKRRRTVRYGDYELDPTAVAAMAKSPDGKYIWTVSLDHGLRAWSTKTGQPCLPRDLLNERVNDEIRKQQKYVMPAEQGTLMQVVPLSQVSNETQAVSRMGDEGEYFIVVHSPKDHQFKFYRVISTLGGANGNTLSIEDIQGGSSLIPPIDILMNTGIWHLDHFQVIPGANNWKNSQIWIQARSGTFCQTFTLTFSLMDKEGLPFDIEDIWQTGWTVVDQGPQTTKALQECLDFPEDLESSAQDVSTPTDRWLQFLFKPGRFSPASLESALYTYRKRRGLPASTGGKGLNALEAPLKERLTQAISAKVLLRRLPNEQLDYEHYSSDIQDQWKAFYADLRILHNLRNEVIGLSVDAETSLPWSICADFIAPVRTCTQFEKLDFNTHLLQDSEDTLLDAIFPDDEDLFHSQILALSKGFSDKLSAEFRDGFSRNATLRALSHETGKVGEENKALVQTLYSTHNFQTEDEDGAYDALLDAADLFGGLGNLTDELILGVIEGMGFEADVRGKELDYCLNRYGDKMTIAIAQETLATHRSVLLDLLMLVVYLYGNRKELGSNAELVTRVGEIYDALVVRLKHNELLSWLAGNLIAQRRSQNHSSESSPKQEEDVVAMTLLEAIFIGDWHSKAPAGLTVSGLLTQLSKQWTYGPNLFDEWDGVTGHVLAFLIKQRSFDLAHEVRKFLTRGEESPAWLRYLEGRLLLATGDYAEASLSFKAAADGMAEGANLHDWDRVPLLTLEERSYFDGGLCSFYQHVLALFERLRIFSYTADFAKLALENAGNEDELRSSLADIDRRKMMMDSPDVNRAAEGRQEASILLKLQKQDGIRSRLSTALIQTGRFGEAFEALADIGEDPIKRAGLSSLIKTCVEQDAVPSLLELPFAERDLVQETDKILLGMAKSGLASGAGSANESYYQILYAFRSQRWDFRGASEVLYEYLERLRFMQNKHGTQNPEDDTLVHAYVLLINTLACCGDQDSWLLADPIEDVHGTEAKRKLVTIADVRRDYGTELDKRSDLLYGRFPLVGAGDAMDVL